MITCSKGDVTIKGESITVITEYVQITRTMFEVLKHMDDHIEITDEKKIACNLMAIIGTALEGSKLTNQKDFYEAIEKICKMEKGWRV